MEAFFEKAVINLGSGKRLQIINVILLKKLVYFLLINVVNVSLFIFDE